MRPRWRANFRFFVFHIENPDFHHFPSEPRAQVGGFVTSRRAANDRVFVGMESLYEIIPGVAEQRFQRAAHQVMRQEVLKVGLPPVAANPYD